MHGRKQALIVSAGLAGGGCLGFLVWWHRQVEVCEDTLRTGNFPPSARIRTHGWPSGAVFEDGTLEKWLDATDLGGAGSCPYRMLVAPGLNFVPCHWTTLYDGTESVGVR